MQELSRQHHSPEIAGCDRSTITAHLIFSDNFVGLKNSFSSAESRATPKSGDFVKMLSNRSMPRCTVIPVLPYAEIEQAIDWLCQAFGFTLRLRIGDHRAQLNVDDGAVILTNGKRRLNSASVMVRIEDVHRHSATAIGHGVLLISAPTDHPYGERQYSVEDLAGHCWTFSQGISDIDPRLC